VTEWRLIRDGDALVFRDCDGGVGTTCGGDEGRESC